MREDRCMLLVTLRAMKDIMDDNKTTVRQPRQRRQRRPRRTAEPRAEEVGSEKVGDPTAEEPIPQKVEEPEPKPDEDESSV